jgi:hypothetical protein
MRNNAPTPTGGNTCFRCGEVRHYANSCPKRNVQNTPGQFNNSRQRQTPQQQQPRNNNQTPQNNKGQQNFIHGCVNHVAAETAQEAQDVVFGMFLVNSAPASVSLLGMGWLSKVDAMIQCAKRSVLLTSPEGERFEFVATLPSAADCAVNQLKADSIEDIRVICEYPMSSPMICQVCHLNVTLNSL